MKSIYLWVFSLLSTILGGKCCSQSQGRHNQSQEGEMVAVRKVTDPLSPLSNNSPEHVDRHLSYLSPHQESPGSLSKEELQTGRENEVRYMLRLEGRDYLLHLTKARDLLADTYSESHYLADGSRITKARHHLDHCCYTGHIEGVGESSVSLCNCQGLSGYISMGDQEYSIDPMDDGSEKHKVSRSWHLRAKRELLPSYSKLVTRNANLSIELFLVADREEFLQNREDLRKTQERLITLAHHVNQIYQKQLNIQIFLVGIEVWTIENKIIPCKDTAKALEKFMQWRSKELVPRKHHDNAQLISGVPFQRSLGQAYTSEMCSKERSGGVVKDYKDNTREVAKYIAHELGHNLGMYHDQPSCHCPVAAGKCLLTSVLSTMNPIFSDCSKKFLNRFLNHFNVSCLKDRPETSINITVALVNDDWSINYKVGVIASASLLVPLLAALVMLVFLKERIPENNIDCTNHISSNLLPQSCM